MRFLVGLLNFYGWYVAIVLALGLVAVLAIWVVRLARGPRSKSVRPRSRRQGPDAP